MIYIAFIILTLLVLIFVFYQWQYFMIFSPTYYRKEPLCEFCSLLSMKTDDNVELEGVIYEPKDPKNTLLVFVGRSHDAVGLINSLAQCYSNSRIVTFNYRAYGKSEGVASEKNFLEDGQKIAELVKKNYGEFYMLGFSIGTSVAAYAASKVEPKALFLLGAFDSIGSLATIKYGFDFSFLLRYKFNTEDFLQKVEAPTYLFVSKTDEIVYIQSARKLKEKISNLVDYEEFEDLAHKELLFDMRIVKKIKEVLEC
jgi:hypothetical protein